LVRDCLLQSIDVLACFEFQPLIWFQLDPLEYRCVDLIDKTTDDDRGVPALARDYERLIEQILWFRHIATDTSV
jgi:hypothetical protein